MRYHNVFTALAWPHQQSRLLARQLPTIPRPIWHQNHASLCMCSSKTGEVSLIWLYPWLGAPIRASPCCEACKMNQGFRLGGSIPNCIKIDMMYCGRPKTEAWTHKATVLGLAGQMNSPGNVRCPNRHSYVFTMIKNETRRDAGAGRNRHDSLPISQKKCPPAVAWDDRTPFSNL